jgi:serine/threonine protein phosphatase PrpC
MIKFKSDGFSVMGSKHRQNDDSIYLNEKEGLFIICDGVSEGGLGKSAAETVTLTIEKAITKANQAFFGATEKIEGTKRLLAMQEIMFRTFAEAQSALRGKIDNEQQKKTSATTCIVVWIYQRFAVIGHIGDSRAYLLRNGKTHLLTQDHSGYHELIKMGLSHEQAKSHQFSRHLTRALGNSQFNQPDVIKLEFQAKDNLLLCTDGVHTALNSNQSFDLFSTDVSKGADLNPWIQKCSLHGDDSSLIQIKFKLDEAFSEDEPTYVNIQAADRIELVRKTPLAKYLTFSQKCHLAAICEFVHVKAGAMIIEEGDFGDDMFIAAKGTLTVSTKNKFIRDSVEGDFFGEIGLYRKQKRTASVKAKTDATLLAISKENLDKALKNDPTFESSIQKALLDTVLDRLTELTAKYANQ